MLRSRGFVYLFSVLENFEIAFITFLSFSIIESLLNFSHYNG